MPVHVEALKNSHKEGRMTLSVQGHYSCLPLASQGRAPGQGLPRGEPALREMWGPQGELKPGTGLGHTGCTPAP